LDAVLAVGLIILARKLSSGVLLAVLALDLGLSYALVVCAGKEAREVFLDSDDVVVVGPVAVALGGCLKLDVLLSVGDLLDFVPFG
jgi:hypothetical protein